MSNEKIARLQLLIEDPCYTDKKVIEWAIDQLRWRHVNEELPDVNGETCLVCYSNREVIEDNVLLAHYDEGPGWLRDGEDGDYVLWWRPIEYPDDKD